MTEKENTSPLHQCIKTAMENYFKQLAGHQGTDIYQMVITEVEKPLLESVLKEAEGNQSRAAAMLGISRSTLRKKMVLHNIL
jgi:Fis family transcriptional regulator